MNNQETFGTQDTERRLTRNQCLLFNACTKPEKGVVVNISFIGFYYILSSNTGIFV